MRVSFIFFCCIFILYDYGFAQGDETGNLVKAWSETGRTQTQKAETTYQPLRTAYDAAKFRDVSQKLDTYLEKHPDDRLMARVYMFQVIGKHLLHIPLLQQDTLKITKAIKKARYLEDEQLLAEIYALAADINFEGGYLLYNLKALELQEKIGFEYFPYVHNRFLGISIALYRAHDYQESIAYGKKCLQFKNTDAIDWDPMTYVFELDMMGASYMALKDYDEAIHCYRQIADTIVTTTYAHRPQELWKAIAEGNIGRCLFYKGDNGQATPLVDAHLAAANKYRQWNNVAIAENARGQILLSQRKLPPAITAFRSAFAAALKSGKLEDRLEQKVKATDGLLSAYGQLGNPDSILLYKNRYSQFLLEHEKVVSNSKLSAMRAQMLFDETRRNLENAHAGMDRLKLTRNIILIAVLVVACFAWLLYSRKSLQTKLTIQQMALENAQTKAETALAKNNLQQFVHQIAEKDRLISNLRQSLNKTIIKNTLNDEQLSRKLLEYVLIKDQEWEKFKEDFNKVHPLFFPRIRAVQPQLSAAEERLASLIFLQMNNNEMATTLGISLESVARSKRRLKQKLSLAGDQSLEEYILTLL
ncbi:hypothetical protein GCM10023091_19440 [Ravibacter arvi]|uniref:HTH luxR-type domain-containing protein n=1 Tax=Ravibacter arvi TaxID=2051041 RepID=A0ABP8LYA7_9BACT